QKRYDAAAKALERSVANNADDPFPRLILARVHTKLSDFPAARKDYEVVLARAPGHHDAVTGLALALHRLGDAGAGPTARQGLGFEELEGTTVQSLLTVLHDNADSAGIREYEERLERLKANQLPTVNLAVILHRFGDAEGAVRVARKALAFDGG